MGRGPVIACFCLAFLYASATARQSLHRRHPRLRHTPPPPPHCQSQCIKQIIKISIKTFIVTICAKTVNLKEIITEYPDFPKEGILFRDISPILKNPDAIEFVASEFGRRFDMSQVDMVAGIESRGFIISTLLGSRYGKGTLMIRKPGKLPGDTASMAYQLEYGQSSLEIQRDAITPRGQRILVCDDLLATGGTANAAAKLVEEAGGTVAGLAFAIELSEIKGCNAISEYRYESLVRY